MSKSTNLYLTNRKTKFILHICIFILISLTLSVYIFTAINNYKKIFDNDADYVKAKATEIIESKNFEAKENVLVRSCNLDLLNDTLTMEIKYKKTNFKVTALNFSTDNVTIKFYRSDVSFEGSPILLYIFCLCLSFILSGLAIFAFYIIIDILSYIGNVIIKIIINIKLLKKTDE